MKTIRNIFNLVVLFLLTWALLGCTTHTKPKPIKERPQWTNHGAGFFIGPQKVLYVIAIKPEAPKKIFIHTVMSRSMEVLWKFAFSFGDTMLDTRKEDEQKREMSSVIEQDAQMYRDMRLASVVAMHGKAVDHWIDLNDGSLYVLTLAEFDKFLENLLKDRTLSRRDRQYFARNAERVFHKVAKKQGALYTKSVWP